MKPGEIVFSRFGNILFGDCQVGDVIYSVGLRNAQGTHDEKMKIQKAMQALIAEEKNK